MQQTASATTSPPAAAKQTTSDRHRWLAVAFICLSLLVISLNNTLLNVALPSVAEDLNATDTQLQWVVDAYLLVFASLQLVMGTLGDGHGRKRALLFGLRTHPGRGRHGACPQRSSATVASINRGQARGPAPTGMVP